MFSRQQAAAGLAVGIFLLTFMPSGVLASFKDDIKAGPLAVPSLSDTQETQPAPSDKKKEKKDGEASEAEEVLPEERELFDDGPISSK